MFFDTVQSMLTSRISDAPISCRSKRPQGGIFACFPIGWFFLCLFRGPEGDFEADSFKASFRFPGHRSTVLVASKLRLTGERAGAAKVAWHKGKCRLHIHKDRIGFTRAVFCGRAKGIWCPKPGHHGVVGRMWGTNTFSTGYARQILVMEAEMSANRNPLFVLFFVLFPLILAACNAPAIVVETPTEPPSKIELIENGDAVKNVHTVSHGAGEYEDVSLESGMAEAQILCGNPEYTFSVGSYGLMNVSELSLSDCPDLATGVKVQLVGTSTKYGFDCWNCTIAMAGEWEIKDGISAWRGTVTITSISSEEPMLRLVPVTMP